MLPLLPSTCLQRSLSNRDNVLGVVENLDTFIATRTYIARNKLTIADIAMWAAIKSSCIFFA